MTGRGTDTEYLELIGGVVWERDPGTGRTLFASQRLTTLFGYTQEEWLDRRCIWPARIFEEDRQEAVRAYQAGLEHRRTFTLEYRMLDRDNRPVMVRDLITPVYDGFGQLRRVGGLLTPTTEQRAYQTLLELNERRWRALLQTGTDLICLFGSDGRPQSVVPGSAAGLSAVRRNDQVLSMIHPSDWRNVLRTWQRVVREGHGSSGSVRHRVRAGPDTWQLVETRLTNLTHDEAVCGYVSSSRDLSLDEAAERRQTASAEKQVLTEKLATLGQLTASLAHEVNTPLSALLTLLHQTEALTDEYRRSIGHPQVTDDDHRAIAQDLHDKTTNARRAADVIGQFIRRLREHTRNTSTGVTVFDPATLTEDTLALLRHGSALAGVELQFEPPKNRAVLRADPYRYSQIVINLVNNAVQACARRPEPGTVTVRLAASMSGLQLQVEDNGCGIPADVLPHIFKPLFTTRAAGSGTGLGLSILRDLIRAEFGGTIDVKTVAGSGSVFTVLLRPQAPGADLELPKAPPLQSSARAVTLPDVN